MSPAAQPAARAVGPGYCYGCGYEPCLMAAYHGGCCRVGLAPVSPFTLGFLALSELCAELAGRPGWTTGARADFLDGVAHRARVERANLPTPAPPPDQLAVGQPLAPTRPDQPSAPQAPAGPEPGSTGWPSRPQTPPRTPPRASTTTPPRGGVRTHSKESS